MYANSFTFIDDVATGSRQNNRVEDRENALKHEARSVRSKTLSAGGVGFGVRWLIALAAGTNGDKHSQAWWRLILLLCDVCALALRVRCRGLRLVRVQSQPLGSMLNVTGFGVKLMNLRVLLYGARPSGNHSGID